VDDLTFSLDDLPPRIERPDATRRLTFDESIGAIEAVLIAALPGTPANRYLERKMEAVTWRRNRGWVTLRNVAPEVVAATFGRPGDLRQLEPHPSDAVTITKLAWEIARHLGRP
jgi:hypothetical protein